MPTVSPMAGKHCYKIFVMTLTKCFTILPIFIALSFDRESVHMNAAHCALLLQRGGGEGESSDITARVKFKVWLRVTTRQCNKQKKPL